MAPSGTKAAAAKTISRTTRRIRRKSSKAHCKKQHKKVVKNQEMSTSLFTVSSITESSKLDSDVSELSTSDCTTPKAQRFRLPEISTCPPAPKKARLLSNCPLKTTPITFFAPPDLELFFFVALQDIAV